MTSNPDLYFAVTLVIRMAVTAAFLIAATVTAERAGPLIGGLVATLPISAGPIYIFMAIDHGAAYIGESALGSLATNAAIVIFTLIYVLLAQKRSMVVSLGGAFIVWAVLNWIVAHVPWSVTGAILFNVVAIAGAAWLTSSLRHVPIPRLRTYWYDFVLRAAMVALLVGVVVTLSHHISASVSGNLAVFPIVLSSVVLVLHPRVGGPATAAVMSNAIIGLGGFGFSILVLHLTAVPLGAPLALILALAVSIGGNLLLFFWRQRKKA